MFTGIKDAGYHHFIFMSAFMYKTISFLVHNSSVYFLFVFSNLAIMAKFGRLMTAADCDFIQRVNDIEKRDGGIALANNNLGLYLRRIT